MAEILGASFPPLKTYCPILPLVSAPQSVFLLLEEEEALYGGAVGGGKSGAALMGALQYVDVPGYAALLMRRTFPELEQPDGLIPQSLRWFAPVPENIRPRYNKEDHEWTFPSGAVIRFGHLDGQNALLRYQGGGYHYVCFDEVTHFAQSEYDFIALSRTRKPPFGPLAQVPIRIRCTANPGGPGHAWVKKKFVTHREPEVAFVPAKLWDNPGIDPDDYVKRLKRMAPVRVKQLVDGDWGAFEGAAFEQFSEELHCVEPFALPTEWDRFESMDYGTTNPTAWLFWAVDYEGNYITFDSYYAPGLPSETAPVILKMRQLTGSYAAVGDPSSLASPTTNRTKLGDKATIQTEFAELGLAIGKADNNPRSGYVRMRELLKPDPKHLFPDWHPRRGQKGSPRWFMFAESCPELVSQLGAAPLQPVERRWAGEMIDPKWESAYGHAVAAARYGAMSRPNSSLRPPKVAETPQERRAEMFEEIWSGRRDLSYAD